MSRKPTLFDEDETTAYIGTGEDAAEFRSMWRRAYPFSIDETFLRDLMEER